MGKFRIQSHGRLQEWVAEEKGHFRAEGLDYEFLVKPIATWSAHVQVVETVPPEIQRGAFESIEGGRGCDLSAACHWTVNMAASAGHGRMWGGCYAVSPSGVFVPPDSPIKKPQDLAHIPVTVGYHSGSHYSTLQYLEEFLKRDEIKLNFAGLLLDRLALLVDRKVAAASLFGAPFYVAEQLGFRKIVDTTFMIGHLIAPCACLARASAWSLKLIRKRFSSGRASGSTRGNFFQPNRPGAGSTRCRCSNNCAGEGSMFR
jgi:NitT/TauT family transport system substrate-binding protein